MSIQFTRTAFFNAVKDDNCYYNERGTDSTSNVIADAKNRTDLVIHEPDSHQFEEFYVENPKSHTFQYKMHTLGKALYSTVKTIAYLAASLFALPVWYTISCIANKIQPINPTQFEKIDLCLFSCIRRCQETYGTWNSLKNEKKGQYNMQDSQFHLTCYALRWQHLNQQGN